MIAVDTNILVRFLTKDDLDQFKKSKQLLQTEQIFIPDTVLLETEWVLRFAYHFKSDNIKVAFSKLFWFRKRSSNSFAFNQIGVRLV